MLELCKYYVTLSDCIEKEEWVCVVDQSCTLATQVCVSTESPSSSLRRHQGQQCLYSVEQKRATNPFLYLKSGPGDRNP